VVTSGVVRRLLGFATSFILATAAATAATTVPTIIPAAASADLTPTTSLPPTGAGVDISFPQCVPGSHADLPANIPFAVVGVNGGVASNSNHCFLSEYNSALLLTGATEQPHASVYVNTGNPALAATWWPEGDTTKSGTAVANPDGSCTHTAVPACAYVYGYSMAQADYRRTRKLLAQLPNLWWLDVETTNTWQADTSANAASLSGMVDYFHSKHLSVGIYSTSYQWKKIAGVTPATSSLAGLRSWLAGGSETGAPRDCEKSPLTPNGWVAMVQYVTHLDNDFSCHLFDSASASVSPAIPTVVGSVLTAEGGAWAPGDVSYAYQWYRDGVAIPVATASTYSTVPADLGANLTVTITGAASGYSTRALTSAPVPILAMTA
jgi:hypothetical protein